MIEQKQAIITPDDPILITGAAGFIGTYVVQRLLAHGFRNLRCFVRPSGDIAKLNALKSEWREAGAALEILTGNLLSSEDCRRATERVAVIYHLAAGSGEKSFPDAYLNSVVTTKALLDACVAGNSLKRFVNVSSFAVYSNDKMPRGRLLDETAPVEQKPELRGDAYTYAKVKQEQLVNAYGENLGLPYVHMRPGVVYGPGKEAITGRIGLGTFGVFLHLGGSNRIPFTYVENCAEAIVLAGIVPGVEKEVFNILDDNPPTSRQFLKRYKRNIRHFRSIYVPQWLSFLLCALWEHYSKWSEGQLPMAFNRRRWKATWKRSTYTNQKLKDKLGWRQVVRSDKAYEHYFCSFARK